MWFYKGHWNVPSLCISNDGQLSCIKEQIERGTRHIDLDLSVGTLRENLCIWLFEAWKTIGLQVDMIIKGWQKYGLLRAFEKDFQVQAMEANTLSLLFGAMSNIDDDCEKEIDLDDQDLEELFEDSDILDLMVNLSAWM